MRRALQNNDWEALLVGDAEAKTHAPTTKLLALQQQYVPSRTYLTRPGDPAWFGYRCRIAAEAKHAAWLRYKRHPSHHNMARHRDTCKRKLCGPGVCSKTWWRLVKERQGTSHHDAVPPLCRPDGTSATSSGDKA